MTPATACKRELAFSDYHSEKKKETGAANEVPSVMVKAYDTSIQMKFWEITRTIGANQRILRIRCNDTLSRCEHYRSALIKRLGLTIDTHDRHRGQSLNRRLVRRQNR
jgi:hypothetical protein